PVRLRSAVADHVAADLAARALDARVALALGHPHLRDRLDAGPRGDRALGQPVERLPDDPDRLAELHHAHAVARVAVARALHRHDEVEVAVRRVRLGPPHVVAHAPATDERARNADRLRDLARDHTAAWRAQAENGVGLQHRFVLVEPPLDEVDGLAHLLVPAGGDVVAGAAGLVKAVEQARAGQLFEPVQDHLALADAIEEHGRA